MLFLAAGPVSNDVALMVCGMARATARPPHDHWGVRPGALDQNWCRVEKPKDAAFLPMRSPSGSGSTTGGTCTWSRVSFGHRLRRMFFDPLCAVVGEAVES